jgi:hypothetical protein
MHVEPLADGRFALVHGARRIELQRAQYEDVFYALPLDAGTLYRLLNDTILTGEPRNVFQALVKEAGGTEKAMAALGEAVTAVPPP